MRWDNRKGKLYRAFLKIGLIGFGGGNALVPIIEKEVVDEQKVIGKAEYEKDIVVASITPGALPLEVAVGVGKKCYGIRGMLMAALLISLPGAVMTLLLLSVLNSVESVVLEQIGFLSVGITAFIMCMLTGYIMRTVEEAKQVSKKSTIFTLLIIAGVFVLTMGKNVYYLLGIDRTPLFSLSTIQVLALAFFVLFYTKCSFNAQNLLVSAIVGIVYLCCVGKRQMITSNMVETVVKMVMILLSLWGFLQSIRKEQKVSKVSAKQLVKESTVWVVLLVTCMLPALWVRKDSIYFMLKGIFSSLISFGGGDAYLVVADGLFVNDEMVAEEVFYGKLVPIVNILPGSILCKTLTGIGYQMGYQVSQSHIQGLIVALLGYASSVAASGGVFCAGYYIFQRYKKLDIFHLLRRLIKPIISGLLLTVMLSLVKQNMSIGLQAVFGPAPVIVIMLFIFFADLYLYQKKKSSNAVLVVLSAVVSCVLCNFLKMV
ncbi:MAG: chromate transporter [Butyribacter sp.]|nr:chromate transporter [bacterium]MDY3853735.1 chromate transporter [Butyribacter sp.]